MAFKLPWSNFHELNLDWILEEMKKLREDVDALTGAASPSSSTPQMDGTASAGSSIDYSRGDHRHPTDTSRASATDLSDAVLTLRGEIGQVDNDLNVLSSRVYFSSMAPSMDGTASAGQSDAQARADHTHPHDSAKADKDAFDTLKARVDGMSGAANPSDTTPLMDGLGSPGTGGNYSRGDHRHPSDTTKLTKSGDHMTGFLIQDKLTASVETSAVGWLRVVSMPEVDGNSARIKVARNAGGAAETHELTASVLNGISFINETSMTTGSNAITSIRYSVDQGYGHFDIYITDANTGTTTVEIEPISPNDQTSISVDSMAFVDNAPDGETIVGTYTFEINTSVFGNLKASAFNEVGIMHYTASHDTSLVINLPDVHNYMLICSGRSATMAKVIMARSNSSGSILAWQITPGTPLGDNVSFTTGTGKITLVGAGYTLYVTVLVLP